MMPSMSHKSIYKIPKAFFMEITNGKLKFKFLKNISHYYNNKFAFHMHMFIIYILSLNKFNITIHSNIKFMVTTYNQNLHFRIHYKKPKTQD